MNHLKDDSAETRRLLEQAAQGDRQAFEDLFAKHRPFLRCVVELRLDTRLRARLDPSDVVQDTQMEAFRRLHDYLGRHPMPFRLWLRKTAHERLIKLHDQHIRAVRRSVRREVPLPEVSSLQLARQLLAQGPTASQQAVKEELARKVRYALGQLSEADREILLMRYVEKLSNQEAGYVLGLNPGTVSKRHGRALMRLQEILKETQSGGRSHD
jgi:RNA polymerase sigma-70 factor (ECF subfamily)